jgi:uncharacterized protein with HEPN domain
LNQTWFRSKRVTELLLEDISEAGRKIIRYTENMSSQEVTSDEKTVDAVIRNFQVIGEAANQINAGFRTRSPEIDWRRTRGSRNRIVHAYFGVDHEIVWSIIQI